MKKAIVGDWLVLVEKGWEASVVLLIGLDSWMMRRSLVFGVGDGRSYTFSMLLASLFWSVLSVKHLREIVVVRPLCLCDIAWCWSVMAMLILN